MVKETSDGRKQYISVLIRLIITILAGVVAGFILLTISYAIPVGRISDNMEQIIERYREEGINPYVVEGNMATRLDNYTDGLMLNGAIYDGDESPVVKAAEVYMTTVDGQMYYDSLLAIFENGNGEVKKESYSRYWHGYMAVLKPLLIIVNYYQLRILNAVVQTILLLLLMLLFFKNRLYSCMVAFGATYLYWSAFIFGASLQYSAMYYIVLLSLIVLLGKKDVVRENYPVYFCITGMAVAYFDLLTYPLAGLGITLALVIILEKEKSWKMLVKQLLANAVCWGMGYAGMWAGKWVLGTIFTKHNLIKEAILQVLYRTSDSASEIGKTDNISLGSVYKQNLTAQSNVIIISIVVFILLANLIYLIACNKKMRMDKVIMLAAVALIPFVWFFVVKNHSYIHYWMTYRNLGITVFSLGCLWEMRKSDN